MDQEMGPEKSRTWSRRRLTLAIGALLFIATGYAARELELLPRVIAKLEQVTGPRLILPDAAAMERAEVVTTFHRVALSSYPVKQAWMLEEIEGHIVFSSRHGHFGYVQGTKVVSLNLVAPLGIENFSTVEETTNPDHIRVTDLLVLPHREHSYHLYVAHLQFARDCTRMVISSTTVIAEAQALHADPDWKQFFSTECLPQRNSGIRHVGNQSGGRLIQLSDTNLALSTGDFEFVGADGEPQVSDSPNSALGKILSISLADGSAHVLASGLRNPQGLLLSRSGELWETEHGPRGGDEVNLIRPDRNYGWPHVTLGAPYGDMTQPSWPSNAIAGAHDGYEPPRYAFTPSIGISNIVEPSVDEFPAWRGTLLVSSLTGSALYLLRTEDGVVLSAERIALPDMRVRDIITLADGRIALSTDAGELVFVENAERKRGQVVALSGLQQLDEGPAFEVMPFYLAQGGDRLFALHCATCHSLAGDPGPGPPLEGIIGARVGSAPDYLYSAALSGRNERWSEERLERFLDGVDELYPGTAMPQPSPDVDLSRIVRFLAARQKAQSGGEKPPG